MEAHQKQREDVLFVRSDLEKKELYGRIEELESACKEYEKIKGKLLEKHFFNKLMFFTQIHKLKGAP
jgi:hypothetical protein